MNIRIVAFIIILAQYQEIVIASPIRNLYQDIKESSINSQLSKITRKENDSTSKGISWEKGLSWNEIKSEAKKLNKYIFIDCFTTWCGPCKRMDKEVYTNDTIAKIFNDKFICVKVQMDKSIDDDKNIRNWYESAVHISNEFKVIGYPTILLLSPEGMLISKEIGYKTVKELTEIGIEALSTKKILLYSELENYKKGYRNTSILLELSKFAFDVLDQTNLAKEIGREFVKTADKTQLRSAEAISILKSIGEEKNTTDSLALLYKKEILDKLPIQNILNDVTFSFITEFPSIINVSDEFFKYFYEHPKSADSIKGETGFALYIVRQAIINDEILPRLRDPKTYELPSKPNWDQIEKQLLTKYDRIEIHKVLLDFKILYYRKLRLDWDIWSYYKDQRMIEYPVNPNNYFDICMEFNDRGAWDVFLNCTDKNVIRKSIKWINNGLNIANTYHPSMFHFVFVDSKANLLYKLGKRKKAIRTQKYAIKIAKEWAARLKIDRSNNTINDLTIQLTKMINKQKTYLEQGAKW